MKDEKTPRFVPAREGSGSSPMSLTLTTMGSPHTRGLPLTPPVTPVAAGPAPPGRPPPRPRPAPCRRPAPGATRPARRRSAPPAWKLRGDLTNAASMVTRPVDETRTLSSVRSLGERRHTLFGLNIEKLSYGATRAHTVYQSRLGEVSRRITLPKMMPGAHLRVPWKSPWQLRLICSTCPNMNVVGKVPEAEGETFDSDVLARPSMRERQLLRRKNTR